MDISSLNWLAVLLAAASGFVVGGLWYGPVFGKGWMAASGMTEEKGRTANRGLQYGGAALLNLIAATSLAMFVGTVSDWRFGLMAGFLTGATFVSTAIGVIYLFEMRPIKLFWINAGYQTVNFSIMGLILGAWR